MKMTIRTCLTLVVITVTHLVTCEARVVDLSHVVKEGSSRWPTQIPFKMNVTFNGTTDAGYWYQSESVCAGTHFSTHLDAPCHFSKGAWCIADIPVDRLVGRPGICLHLRDKVGMNGDYQVDERDFQAWEDEHGQIPTGSIVLVNTGWSRFWEDENRYRGTADPSPRQHRFPGVSPNAAQWLADERHIYGVGIDTLSIDYGQTRYYESHVLLGRRNAFVLENLANLDSLPPNGFSVHAMVIKLNKASGGPARVVAVVNGGSPRISVSSATFVSLLLGLVFVTFAGRWFRRAL